LHITYWLVYGSKAVYDVCQLSYLSVFVVIILLSTCYELAIVTLFNDLCSRSELHIIKSCKKLKFYRHVCKLR